MYKIKTIFLHKYTFYLLFALFCLWYTIDSLYGYKFSDKKLDGYHGTISMLSDTIKTQPEYYGKGVIMLSNKPNVYFKVNDFKFYQKYILKELNIGDQVIIYPTPRLYRSGISHTVIKLVKMNGITVYNGTKIFNEVSLKLFFVFFVLFLVSLTIYIRKLKKMISHI